MNRNGETHAVTLRLPIDVYDHLVSKANLDARKLAPFLVKMLTDQMNAEKEEAKKS